MDSPSPKERLGCMLIMLGIAAVILASGFSCHLIVSADRESNPIPVRAEAEE